MNPYSIMLCCYILSLAYFLAGFYEALKIAGVKGKVEATPFISYILLATLFTFFSHYYWKLTI
ncbi:MULTISPECIES: hypothetical protein [Bacillus]|uniref:Uncharacterized protein n=1 Tax=Bacillus pumilus TaxID=1408 RepID=A0A2G8IPA5_BACPU|nr:MULTISPECIES: hypothetical protein [Bacillus]MCC9088797.1 hypothetical protein [Bacillus pumilus]MED1750003.1 hypothetical protein [Bacillus zhangzhouensis]PIK25345.1 hypothetical protein CTV99_18265 [Bacillus pumilus]UUD41884.1 hypothetical protein NPA43_13795 [Bacillus pumilus]